MKLLCLLGLFFLFAAPPAQWQTDFAAAKKEAVDSHKLILLNFSGSDWCGPCIRLRKEVFNTDTFSNFASTNLVLVNADFPRSSKNQLSAAQQGANNALADKYNKEGHFPYTVLLKTDGAILKIWDGFPGKNAAAMIDEIKLLIPDNK